MSACPPALGAVEGGVIRQTDSPGGDSIVPAKRSAFSGVPPGSARLVWFGGDLPVAFAGVRVNPSRLAKRVAVFGDPIEDDVAGYGQRDSTAAIFARAAVISMC